ncbi:hypothetical protein RJZ56_000283 [Blastomyces dermatitidis]
MKRCSAVSLLLSTDGLEVELSQHDAGDLLLQSLSMGLLHIVKKLLVLPSRSTESRYLYEWTTRLTFAVVRSDKAAVTSLLTNTAVALTTKPFLELGHVTVVKLLLGHEDIEPDTECDVSWTTLGGAVYNGRIRYRWLFYEEMWRLRERLLLREDINVVHIDTVANTPLDTAILRLSGDKQQRMVELLLTKGAVHRQELLSPKEVLSKADLVA